MFKNLLIDMDLSPASICLLPCMGSLRDVGAESATLLHVMDVHRVGESEIEAYARSIAGNLDVPPEAVREAARSVLSVQAFGSKPA